MPTCVLDNAEQIQHTLTMYGRIKHTSEWYTWVLTKTNDFEDGAITVYQNVMNQSAIKYAKISIFHEGKFTGYGKNITEDIVSMISDSTRHQRAPRQTTHKPCTPATKQ